jgi:hypothetical protein
MALLSDNPILSAGQDGWHLGDAAAELYDGLVALDELPATFGVFGAWGSGKTSLLRLVEDRAKGDGRYRPVWFNAWKYDNREDVWPALVQAVLAELASETLPKAALRKIALLARVAGQIFAARSVQFLTHGIVCAQDVDNLVVRFGDLKKDAQAQLGGFDQAFDEVLKESLGDRRLLLLIDDLDRCSPASALDVLEGIKLFLASSRCVFLVALDFDSLLTALRALDGRDASYRLNYLEKMIQAVRYVPSPSSAELRQTLHSLSGIELSDELWFLVQQAAAENPRRAKRFLNMLILAGNKYTGPAQQDRTRYLLLAKLLVIRAQFPDFFAMLASDPGLWKRAEDGILSDPEEIAAELGPVAERLRLVRFLRETAPARRYLYPPAPENVEAEAMLSIASAYSPGVTPLATGEPHAR